VFVAAFSRDPYVTQTWEGQVGGENAQPIGGGAIENFRPCLDCLSRVGVERELPIGMSKREQMMMRAVHEVEQLVIA
jgi:hypothetical protein